MGVAARASRTTRFLGLSATPALRESAWWLRAAIRLSRTAGECRPSGQTPSIPWAAISDAQNHGVDPRPEGPFTWGRRVSATPSA
jgi:hypothetical protein